MSEHPIAPGWVDILVNDGKRNHHNKLPVSPAGTVTIGTEPSFQTKGGSSVPMSDLVAAWATLIKPFYAAAVTIVEADFWSQPSAESDPVWVYAVPIGVIGTATGATTYTRQYMETFRTMSGNLLKLVFLPCAASIPVDVAGGLTVTDPIAAFVVSNDDWIIGRDNAFPAAPLSYSVKTNDALRRKELGL